MTHPFVERIETPQPDATGVANASNADAPVERVEWRDGRVSIVGEHALELDENTPFSVQLSRWRRQLHEDGLVERVRVVDELHIEVRPSVGPRVSFFAELDAAELDGLPWLERTRTAQLDRADVEPLLAGFASAGGRPTRWQEDDLGTAPILQKTRTLGALNTIGVAAGSGVLASLGQIFLAFGLLVFFFLGTMGDPGSLTFDAAHRADGRVVEVEDTDAAENDRPVVAYHFEYEHQGALREGVSYDTGAQVSTGDEVVVEVDEDGRARIAGMRMSLFGPLIFFGTLIFPIIGLAIAGFALHRGLRDVRVLRHGRLTRGRMAGKRATNTRVNNRRVMEVTFDFTDHRGQSHTARGRGVDTRRMEDEPSERILYLEHDPRKNLVVDAIGGGLDIGPDGEIRGRVAWTSLILPTVLCVEMALMVVVGLVG